MGAGLVATFFTLLSSAGAFIVSPKKGDFGLMRILALWVFSAAVAFFIRDKLIALFIIGFAAAFIAGRDPVTRVCVYLGAFAALPHHFTTVIPFPGINYLIYVHYLKMMTIFILGPVFVTQLSRPGPKHLKMVDNLLLAFVLLTGVMTIRDLPFTSVLRSIVDQFLLVYVPYIAISRSIRTQEDVEKALKALFTGFSVLVGIGVISTLLSWNYYAALSSGLNYKIYADYRNGLLRIYGTAVPTLMGCFMGLGLACAYWLKMIKAMPFLFMLVLTGAFTVVCYATGARGGWLAMLLVMTSLVVFTKLNGGLRRLYLIGLVLGVIVVFNLIFNESELLNDQYGTYNYRADLMRVSIPQIASRPLFGSSSFLEKPSFEALRQGEGIIDLVNAYLQITLFYGLTGLGLFLSAHISAIRSCLKQFGQLSQKAPPTSPEGKVFRSAALLMAMQIAYLGMIATASGVSYIWNLGYIIVAMVVAQARSMALQPVSEIQAAPQSAEPDDEAIDKPVSASAEPRPRRVPYGARFVRRP